MKLHVISNDASDSDVLVRVQVAGHNAADHNRRGTPANPDAVSDRMLTCNIQPNSAS